MRHTAITILVAMFLSLCACGVADDELSQYGNVTARRAADAAAPARGAFIGRTWVATSAGPERGFVIAFLADRTVLMSACPGPLRVSKWGVAGNRIRWIEDSIPIEADVMLPGKDELQLRIVGRERPEHYVAVSPPFTCSADGW